MRGAGGVESFNLNHLHIHWTPWVLARGFYAGPPYASTRRSKGTESFFRLYLDAFCTCQCYLSQGIIVTGPFPICVPAVLAPAHLMLLLPPRDRSCKHTHHTKRRSSHGTPKKRMKRGKERVRGKEKTVASTDMADLDVKRFPSKTFAQVD